MKFYLAYGSNLSVEAMAHRCPEASIVGTAFLDGWRLVFRHHATIEPCEGFSVPVLVWRISDADEKRLDFYEGFPSYYVKRWFPVRVVPLDGSQEAFEVRAMVYLMVPGQLVSEPDRGYFGVISEGYQRFGFDRAILHEALEEAMYNEGFPTYF